MSKIYNQYMYSYPHKTAYLPIPSKFVSEHLSAMESGGTLYLHLPFCQSKCGYCNLFSVAGAGNMIDPYIDAVERQCRQLASILPPSVSFSSLVLGGGTPSLLSTAQLERLFEIIESTLGVTPQSTYSVIEVSPNQTSLPLLRMLKDRGFNRVSMGVQSFDERELRLINRVHSSQSCVQALDRLKLVGFDTLNADLIYGLPGQTEASLLYSSERLLEFSPDEVFLYPLYIKPHTPLWGKVETDEHHTLDLYRKGQERLLLAGYHQVSMRRFVKTLTIPSDCGFSQGLAIGCGGRSYLGSLHFCQPYQISPAHCKAALEHFCAQTDFLEGLTGYLLDDDEVRRHYMVKHLMHYSGVSRPRYTELFGTDPVEDFPFLSLLIPQGLLWADQSTVRLTDEGLAFSDQIGPLFISPKAAEQSRCFYNKY